jgi:hypothetical protein
MDNRRHEVDVEYGVYIDEVKHNADKQEAIAAEASHGCGGKGKERCTQASGGAGK